MDVDLLVTILDFIATLTFAYVGARVAANKGLDYGGITLISTVAALAGGTFRNLFLGLRPHWILHPWIFTSVVIAVLVTIIGRQVGPVGRAILSFDSMGLAVAGVSSSQLAITHGAGFVGTIVLGVIGAITGGLLRDLMCQVEPVVLHRETIATATLAGCTMYALFNYWHIDPWLSTLCGAAVIIAVREISIKYDINLPKVRRD